MIMPKQQPKMDDPEGQALKDILKLIVETGLVDGLEMPSEEPPMSDPLTQEMAPEPEGELMEEMEDESEKLDKPISLSITQLGAMKKPEPKKPAPSKGRNKKKRGK